MREQLKAAEQRDGLLVCGELMDSGMSRAQVDGALRLGVLERAARNVYRAPGSVPTWRQRLLAAVLAAGPGAAASHRSAAALWGIPGFPAGLIEISRTRPHRSHRLRLDGAVLHESLQLPEHHRREVRGIPVTSPARTAFDVCAAFRRSPKRAARAVDNFLKLGLCTPGDLHVMLIEVARRGRPGVQLFRALLEERGEGYVPTESELEDLTQAVLRGSGIWNAVRQVQLGGTDGDIGRVDFYIREAALVIEADSRAHHDGWAATVADYTRRAKLMAAGFAVLPVTYHQLVHEPEPFLDAVRAVIERSRVAP